MPLRWMGLRLSVFAGWIEEGKSRSPIELSKLHLEVKVAGDGVLRKLIKLPLIRE
ncbi:hypothetical protein D3C85_1682630 [compost metagenome]